MKRIVMILGMHRSGTSVVTQICQCMGAYLGEPYELMAASKNNPEGYFENKKISHINDDILRFCGREWYTLDSLELDYNHHSMKEMMEKLKTCIQELLERSDTIAIKDPRVSVLLPLWEKILDELGAEVCYIWVYRNPLEVAESLRKRDNYSRRHSLLLWVYYNLSILKFLKKKDYLLVNYKDVLENCRAIEDLSRLFGKELDGDLKWELNQIVKHGYCHSNYSDQMSLNGQKELFSDFYYALLEKQEFKINISEYEKQYMEEIIKPEEVYVDYEVLENIKYLEQKELLIYGAGNYGRQAAKMLQELSFSEFTFCDKDTTKHGTKLMGGTIFSIKEVEKRENLCVIIAVEKEELKKKIEQTLLYIKDVKFLSFFALKAIWKYFASENVTLERKVGEFSFWYETLMMRGNTIKNACRCPVLVYQNGKVGSSTVSHSLRAVGIENAHIHRFFFKNDIVGKLLLGNEQINFIKNTNIFQIQSLEYVKDVKDKMKDKKIITMVRDPIAVDLSTVFQWIGSGITDRYFAKQLKQGKTFLQIVSELMVRIQDRLFEWFNEELKELCEIDVFQHPFDKEKGWTVIRENNVEILLLKAEKLSQMTEVIRKFVGSHQLELVNENMGRDKGYAHIYKETKKRLKIPREYVEHYYKNNLYMDHFYTEEEKENFLKKWARCIQGE